MAEVLETEVGNRQRPAPTGEVQEREIDRKMFKLGASIDQRLQDQIAEVIA